MLLRRNDAVYLALGVATVPAWFGSGNLLYALIGSALAVSMLYYFAVHVRTTFSPSHWIHSAFLFAVGGCLLVGAADVIVYELTDGLNEESVPVVFAVIFLPVALYGLAMMGCALFSARSAAAWMCYLYWWERKNDVRNT